MRVHFITIKKMYKNRISVFLRFASSTSVKKLDFKSHEISLRIFSTNDGTPGNNAKTRRIVVFVQNKHIKKLFPEKSTLSLSLLALVRLLPSPSPRSFPSCPKSRQRPRTSPERNPASKRWLRKATSSCRVEFRVGTERNREMAL